MSDPKSAKPELRPPSGRRLSRAAQAKTAFGLAAFMTIAPAQAAFAQDDKYVDVDTKYSRHVQSLVEEFNAKAKDVRIVLMDRDWFQANLALEQIPAYDSQARAALAADYIRERTGVEVPVDNLRFYGVGNDIEGGEGYAWPSGAGPTGGMNPGACIVFGQLADVDAESQVKYLTGVGGDLHPELAGRELKNVMPLNVMRKYVDYHEIGHCLYHSQMDRNYSSLGEALVERNRSEMYAEVMAALLLAHYDGVTDFAEKAGNLRLVSGMLNGPAFARFQAPGTLRYYSPALYTIAAGVKQAGLEIENLGLRAIQRMSLDEMRELAHKIVDRHALDVEKMDAVMLMFKDQFDLANVYKLSQEKPEYREAYEYAARLRAEMAAALPKVVDMKGFDKKKPVWDHIKIDFTAFQARQLQKFSSPPARTGPTDEQIIKVLKDRLIYMAGGDKATTEKLVEAFREHKDFQRKKLEKGNDPQRETVMRWLPLMGDALYEAVAEVEGRTPGADNRQQKKITPRGEFFGPDFMP